MTIGVPWRIMRQALQRQVSKTNHNVTWSVCLFRFEYGVVEVNKQRWRVVVLYITVLLHLVVRQVHQHQSRVNDYIAMSAGA